MPKIHQLPLQIVAKIAAGEVIERPAYAVKELIENAIDAKADNIQIAIEQAGLKKIQVLDNGEGMSQEDLEESWKPHTTSKISEKDSLIGIKSFGFRGEALASLSAVSRLTIKSRLNGAVILNVSEESQAKNNEKTLEKRDPSNSFYSVQDDNLLGHLVVVENGKLISSHPVGMPQGTIVTAENLFSNIPARKKFLKTPQTEMRHIVDVVNQFAGAYPEIHFSLIHNNRMVLDAPKTSDKLSRLQNILGKEAFKFLIPVKRNDSYIKITGFVAKPQIYSSSTSKQFIYVNKRKITDKMLSLAVKEAFGTMLESSSYPVFILFLEMPFEMIDINVHPRKEQVSFVNTQNIFQFVKEIITEVLQSNNITFQNLSWKRSGVGTTNTYAGKLLKDTILDKEKLSIDSNNHLTQLHKLYIVSQTKNSIIFVDQHAAHERILFEKLRKEFVKQKNKNSSIKLSPPVQLNLSTTEQLLLEEHKKIFKDLGFIYFSREEQNDKSRGQNNNISQPRPSTEGLRSNNKNYSSIKQFNSKKILLSNIPQLFQDRNPRELIISFLEQLEQGKHLSDVDNVSEEMLAFLACRAAVKSGDLLDEKLMEKIITDLDKTPNNVTCPHGRPTHILLSLQDLNAQFKR